jgi:ribulose-phosphate 3-epimerase
VEKVARIKDIFSVAPNPVLLQVDGGVNAKTAPLLWEAGADILVAGSYVFGADDYKQAIDSIRKG